MPEEMAACQPRQCSYKSIHWTLFDKFEVLPFNSNTFWRCPVSKWHLRWDGPTWNNSSTCSALVLLIISNIISVTFPKFCQAPSGFCCQSLSQLQVSIDCFDIQLAKLKVHKETISTQPICHEEACVLHHLQSKPPPESTEPEQSVKPNHTFVHDSKRVLSLLGHGLKAGPAPALCSGSPVRAKQSNCRVPDKFRKQGNESN